MAKTRPCDTRGRFDIIHLCRLKGRGAGFPAREGGDCGTICDKTRLKLRLKDYIGEATAYDKKLML